MSHETVPSASDERWHFEISKTNPSCLTQILDSEERDDYGILRDDYGILRDDYGIRPPATYQGFVYNIAPGPPPAVTRIPIPGHIYAAGLCRCWKELSDYWTSSRSKTADKLFNEYLDIKLHTEWGAPFKVLTDISRDRVCNVAKLVRRVQIPPCGYDASHIEIAPRVSADALILYDMLSQCRPRTTPRKGVV